MKEIDWRMAINDAGIIVHEDVSAAENCLYEWLSTPQGTVYGMPSWGNPLHNFKHEPANIAINFMMKNAILSGINRDMPDVKISEIKIEPDKNKIDVIKVVLRLPWGYLDTDISLGR